MAYGGSNGQTRDQGCSGAGTRRSAVPANIFQPERRSGKYCLSCIAAGTLIYCSLPANQLILLVSYFSHEIWPFYTPKNH